MAKLKIDWVIHCCRNGAPCAECGKVETGYLKFACNAHTHGMERYNHPDFQVVLNWPDNEIARILNTFGLWVQEGKTFVSGDTVSGIYEDCDVRLEEFEETGRNVLRIIVPDKNNVFPSDKNCMYPYTLQTLPTDMLWSKGGENK